MSKSPEIDFKLCQTLRTVSKNFRNCTSYSFSRVNNSFASLWPTRRSTRRAPASASWPSRRRCALGPRRGRPRAPGCASPRARRSARRPTAKLARILQFLVQNFANFWRARSPLYNEKCIPKIAGPFFARRSLRS